MTDFRDSDTPVVRPSAKPAPLEYASLVLVVAAALLLLAGVIYAFAVAGARDAGGSERFRLLAQAASPFVAGLALAAVAVVMPREGAREQVAAPVTIAVGSAVALVALLLALNGIVVDLTTGGVGAMFKLSNVIGRLATVSLAGFALWVSATSPVRRGRP